MYKKTFTTVIFLITISVSTIVMSGVTNQEGKTFNGYTLFSPLNNNPTYLINMEGQIVHTWNLDSSASFSTYFLDNSHIFRSASTGAGFGGLGGGSGFGRGQRTGAAGAQEGQNQRRSPGGVGAGGKLQEIDWDGNIVWEFEYKTETQVPHHDIARMPNGNILLICWDAKTDEEAIAAGRNPEYQTAELPPDCVIEIKPTGENSGEVVWKWYVWDHLIQEFDPNKPNHGDVAAHPELIDINYSESWMDQPARGDGQNAPPSGQNVFGAFRNAPDSGPGVRSGGNRRGVGFGGAGGFGTGLGGFGGGGFNPGGRIGTADWTHLNAIDYNQELDLIVVSSYTFSEIWVIDHSTTTEEAKGHTGGKHGKGGDLLYRYGNPAAYKQGTNDDQKFFCPHDIQWIAKGLPGEGHMLIFNNGPNRQDGRYSSVEEFILPVDDNGNFKMDGKVFAAVEPVWQYTDPNDKTNFYATNISGAQRLPNGNTLICEGPRGHLFEVTPDKEIVWDYRFSAPDGARGGGIGAMGGQGVFGGAGGFGMRGQAAAPADADSDIAAPQGQIGTGMRGQRGQGGNVGIAGGARRGGTRGGGGMDVAIFRAYRIAKNHPALTGKDLTPQENN